MEDLLAEGMDKAEQARSPNYLLCYENEMWVVN
jgi:hypothetical protein